MSPLWVGQEGIGPTSSWHCPARVCGIVTRGFELPSGVDNCTFRPARTMNSALKRLTDHMRIVSIRCPNATFGEWKQEGLIRAVCVVCKRQRSPFKASTLLTAALRNSAIVVRRTTSRVSPCTRHTMVPSYLKSMASCNSWTLSLRVPSLLAAFTFVPRLPYFISSLRDYKSSLTHAYPCLSLHHPFVGCPHLQYTTLPLYQIPVSLHIYNSLTSSPSYGSHTQFCLLCSSRSASICPRHRRREL